MRDLEQLHERLDQIQRAVCRAWADVLETEKQKDRRFVFVAGLITGLGLAAIAVGIAYILRS